MKRSGLLVVGIAVGSWGVRAGAQGADDCTNAVAIAGNGTFAVSTVGSTDSPEQSGACVTAHHDVWFRWTAAQSGGVAFETCGGATVDTVLAVYSGSSCPSPSALIACNDDSCGFQSSLSFSAVAGTTYMLQLGAWDPAVTYTGTFTLGAGTGGCSNPSSGPDVIVGDITEVLNANPTAGLDAFAVGVGACNVGDTVLNWFAPTNLHPVISYNLYRYKLVNGAGRMEQVGISWLKHGFGAATESLCCSCQNPSNGQLLGIGCSDTYGSSLNGDQATLGPRWQVNAHTGVFAYPPANPGWSGTTARRCEIALSDLELTAGNTTRFLCEAAYVTQDDAQAGNNDNNTSWKEMAVTGGVANYNFALSGSVQATQTALEGWASIEPGVTIADVHVPGDGRMLVGSHATFLGDGLFHYEFAVHNMNSDRNCGSFTVVYRAGATITNIGFHDVTYRNGDGPGNVSVDGTDWTATVGPETITWTCAPEALDPRANCIRWGTTYNFRFDANIVPVNGSVALGLWKSGAPGTVAAAAQVPDVGPLAQGLCFGDGSGTPCPCGNNSSVGADAGCLNSFGSAGLLATSGSPSITSDTFTLLGTGMPNASALYFQGTTSVGAGAGSTFGDGLRCAAGAVVRLGIKTNAGGSSSYPGAGDASISVRGGNAIGNVRFYQCWYRNNAAFCQPEGFNLTNAIRATWQP